MHAHAHHGASPSFRYLHGLSKVGSLARSALCTLLTSALVPPATGAKATEYQRAAVQFLNESVLPHPGQSLPEVLLAQDDAAEYSESFDETSNEGTPKPAPVTARAELPTSSVAARHDARATGGSGIGGSGIAGSGGGGGRASCRAPPAATTRPAVRPVAARTHMLPPSEDPPSDELESLSLDVEDILPH